MRTDNCNAIILLPALETEKFVYCISSSGHLGTKLVFQIVLRYEAITLSHRDTLGLKNERIYS